MALLFVIIMLLVLSFVGDEAFCGMVASILEKILIGLIYFCIYVLPFLFLIVFLSLLSR